MDDLYKKKTEGKAAVGLPEGKAVALAAGIRRGGDAIGLKTKTVISYFRKSFSRFFRFLALYENGSDN